MNLTWTTLALREARRRPLRTGITVFGIAVAVAALASLLAFEQGYRRGLGRELDRLGAHVLVVPKGCPYDAASLALHGANWPCFLKSSYLEEVRAVNGVAGAAPALMSAFERPDGTRLVVVGATEDLLALKSGWQITGRFPTAPDEILVGADLVRRHGWRTGESVAVTDLPGNRRVSGVLAPTGGADDSFLFLPLATAQRDLRREGVLTHILVRLRDPGDLDGAVQRLRGCNAGMDMNIVPLTHLFRTIQGMMASTQAWLASVALVAWLAAATGLGNTVLMAVAERSREIGVLRALGASAGDVFRLFWIETLILSGLGGGLGLLVATASARLVEDWLRDHLPFAPSDRLVSVEPALAAGCLLMALVLGSLSGFLPAWRASRLPPRLAMRAPAGS